MLLEIVEENAHRFRVPEKHHSQIGSATKARYSNIFTTIRNEREISDHEAGPLCANPWINSRRTANFSLNHCLTILLTALFSTESRVAGNESSIPAKGTSVIDIFESSKA